MKKKHLKRLNNKVNLESLEIIVISIRIKNLLSLSNQKFSSNVVEKCIQVSDRVKII